MLQATSVLKKESKNQQEQKDGVNDASTTKFDVPVFDKSVDYVTKVKEQSMLLKKMQSLHEDHSVDFLSMLKESVRAEKRLKTKIA